jgi:hypothetical protein
MNPILRNILAVIAGLVIGGAVNMGIIMISSSVIPPPEGADLSTMEGLKAAMHLMGPKHFLMPFLAHALGTFIGAFIVTKLAANNTLKFALIIGVLNFIGGATNVAMLPSPLWFSILDLAVAYFPMAYLGWVLGGKGQK